MKYFLKDLILPICVFKDRDLELSYQAKSFSTYKKVIGSFFVAIMAVFVFFSIPDFIFLSQHGSFIHDLVLRFSLVAICVIFYFSFGRLVNSRSYVRTINAFEISFSVFYLLILSSYSDMSFLIKCIDIIIIITFYFSLPNKWLNSLLQSIALITAFALFCIINTARFEASSNFAAGAVYICIAFALNAINFYRINYYKRSQFYNINMLKKLIYTDALTGASTRAKFDEDIKRQILISDKTGHRLSIAIFDIDNFKHINDTYGHIEGDNVLTGIVNAVTESKRQKDILSRWGGEEFVILFPSTNLSFAAKITDRLRLAISSAKFSIGERVTCSFGVTEYQQGDTPTTLMRRADKFMYDAKAAGKNFVVSGM